MIVVYSPRYRIDIGPHVFPTDKYQRIHARLLETGVIQPSDVVEPEPASWDELALVHSAEYLEKMRDGTLSPEDVAQLELPWSQAMVDGFRVMTGGTILAALLAVGTQSIAEHAEHAEQQCSAIAAALRSMSSATSVAACTTPSRATAKASVRSTTSPWRRGCCRRAASSGSRSSTSTSTTATAPRSSSKSDPRVYTFSMHQQHNYPMWKPRGSRDIGLPDGAHDATFLDELERALPAVIDHQPACVFYLAGADPYEDDQLGGCG